MAKANPDCPNVSATSPTIHPVAGAELHLHYPRQTSPQPCHVELDLRRGDLSASANTEIGNAVPMAVHHGHVQRWTIPALRANSVNALLAEIAPLAGRVVAGYTSEWDGSYHVAVLNEDATDAQSEIEALCDATRSDDEARLRVWSASDWFAAIGDRIAQAVGIGITAATTDDELDTIADRETAAADDVDVLEGLRPYLRDLRVEVQS